MDLPAARLQQRFIRNIAHQSVFESIPRGWPALDDSNDLVPLEVLDCRIQFCLGYGGDSKQQVVGKLPTDYCSSLRHAARLRDTVEPCRERIAQRFRYRPGRSQLHGG